jgi:hypothetical protein
MRLLLAIAVAALLGTTPTLADRPTARASGVQAVHTHPRLGSPTLDKLADQERVYLDKCTRHARWCHVIQLDGGPGGWVPGSYLIGSPAKVMVTPFEFSFDPLHPLGGAPGHDDHWPFD